MHTPLNVKMQLRISKSPRTVFEAIVDPAKMSNYFTSSGTGRLDEETEVTWQFADVGAELVVAPQKVKPDRHISYLWSASGVQTLVQITLERSGRSATVVKVSESGWPTGPKGIGRCIAQTRGWAHMLSCMKAYLEHGIHLRSGGTIE